MTMTISARERFNEMVALKQRTPLTFSPELDRFAFLAWTHGISYTDLDMPKFDESLMPS